MESFTYILDLSKKFFKKDKKIKAPNTDSQTQEVEQTNKEG